MPKRYLTPSQIVARADRDYVTSGSWKCPESPTGAHHWAGSDGVLTCLYCSSTRETPSNLNDITPWILTRLLYRNYESLEALLLEREGYPEDRQ